MGWLDAYVSVVVIASFPPAPCRNSAMFSGAKAGVIHRAGAPTTSGDGDSLLWGPGGLPLALRLREGLGLSFGVVVDDDKYTLGCVIKDHH